MHPRISVHSICFPGAGVEELGRHWRALGAQRVSFSSQQLLDYGAQNARRMLDAAGQQTETIAHVFRTGALAASHAEMHAEQAQLARTIEAAAALGARSIYMLTGGRGMMGWEEAAGIFAQAIAPCRQLARDAGVALAIENTNPFHAHAHFANNLRDMITLAEYADISICIDMFACWTEADLRNLIRRALPRLVLVQASDYVPGDRALPCRAVPGDGAIPWPLICSWLQEDGYTGTFDLELLGPRIDEEGHAAAVQRAANYMEECLQRLAPSYQGGAAC